MKRAIAMLVVLAGGCSRDGARDVPPGGPPDLASGNCPAGGQMLIDPSEATLEVTCNGGDGAARFRAFVVDGGRILADVTDRAMWAVDNKDMGQVTKGLLKPRCPLPHGGVVIISAVDCGIVSASIAVHYSAPPVFAAGAAADSATSFGGPQASKPAEIPVVLYPLDGAVLVPNFPAPEFQWTASPGHSLFRLRATGDYIDQTIYLGPEACTPQQGRQICHYLPDATVWSTIARSAQGLRVSFTLSAVAGAGMPVAETPPFSLGIAPESFRGGMIWYSPSSRGLKQVPEGATQAVDFAGPAKGGQCVGCHATTMGGTRVAATFGDFDGAGGIMASGGSLAVPPDSMRWNQATFSPDHSLLLTSWAGILTLRDAATGMKKADVTAEITGGRAVMPTWSWDGRSVAFVQLDAAARLGRDFPNSKWNAGDWVIGNGGSIAVMDLADGAFQPAKVLVAQLERREYHYHPTWSPDSKWIAFVTASWPGSSPTAAERIAGVPNALLPPSVVVSYAQDATRLRMVSTDGQLPVELARASRSLDNASRGVTWPRFAPVVQQGPGGSQIVFLTFSARFDYGVRVREGTLSQLWTSAIDLAVAEKGQEDPSAPPFWLPYQDPKDIGYSATWTWRRVCNTDMDCFPGRVCRDGECVWTR